MRTAARTDENQAGIVEDFRDMGASVAATHSVGHGFPDLVIGYHGASCLVEIKNPNQPNSKRKLTPKQVAFHRDWRGAIAIVETRDDIIELLAIMRGDTPRET
jgi:hypothetical protein